LSRCTVWAQAIKGSGAGKIKYILILVASFSGFLLRNLVWLEDWFRPSPLTSRKHHDSRPSLTTSNLNSNLLLFGLCLCLFDSFSSLYTVWGLDQRVDPALPSSRPHFAVILPFCDRQPVPSFSSTRNIYRTARYPTPAFSIPFPRLLCLRPNSSIYTP